MSTHKLMCFQCRRLRMSMQCFCRIRAGGPRYSRFRLFSDLKTDNEGENVVPAYFSLFRLQIVILVFAVEDFSGT
jgi:hypothetical protein